MVSAKLLKTLYEAGLGHHLVLHRTSDRVFLGSLKFEKGKMVIRDNGYLENIKPATLDPCFDNGTIGMICKSDQYEWESLTFYGIEKTSIKTDLSKTRNAALVAAENQYGDKLINFTGSIYRGFHLLLENHFLPVILLQAILSKRGEIGLVVADLRTIPMDIKKISTLNDDVMRTIEKYTLLDVNDELKISDNDFEEMFGKFRLPP
jgi:hypothetical protein